MSSSFVMDWRSSRPVGTGMDLVLARPKQLRTPLFGGSLVGIPVVAHVIPCGLLADPVFFCCFISRELAVVDPTAYVQTLLLGVLHVATSCLHREIGCPLPVILCTGYCKQCPFSTPSVSSFSLPLHHEVITPFRSTDKFSRTILSHLFSCFFGKSSTEHHSAFNFPPQSDEKIYANLRVYFISESFSLLQQFYLLYVRFNFTTNREPIRFPTEHTPMPAL